jgi:hypothetical protein
MDGEVLDGRGKREGREGGETVWLSKEKKEE